ncbi:PspC domain-containing protein [Oerskovia flava]|uniref:PspC domain-containing protein n=1 Tax=Oerskovia flava TaxID=2986422 RepID=UPI00224085EA|nr:PspC domain-containing protein [Oerskovia sp. JB1-3-2]
MSTENQPPLGSGGATDDTTGTAHGPDRPDPMRSHDHAGPTGPTGPAGPNPTGGNQGWHGEQKPPFQVRLDGADGFFDRIRRAGISRSDDRWVGGVAAGVADRFGIDPLLVRGLLFVSLFVSGAGIVLYGLAWALLPERRDGRIHLQEAFRGNFDVAMLGAIAVFIVGLNWGFGWFSWWNRLGLGWLNGLFWLAAVATVAVVAITLVSQRSSTSSSSGNRPHPSGGPAAPPAQPAPLASPPPYGWSAATGPATYPPTAPVGGADDAPADAPPPASSQQWSPQSSQQWSPQSSQPWAQRGATPPPTPPTKPAAPNTPGPGATTVGIVLGLSFLTAAVLLLLDRQGLVGSSVALTWIGASVVLAGLGIVLAGFRGRTGGALTALAVLVIIFVAAPLAVWRAVPTIDGPTRWVSEGTYTVRTVAEAERGYSVNFGDPVVDLTELDLSTVPDDETVTVPIHLAAGDVTVIVPADTAVEAQVRVFAGEAHWFVDRDETASGVSTRPSTFTSDEVDAGQTPALRLEIEAGAGQVTITEES